ncbi:NUMOD4 domain-containing protein [Hymenobacter lapidarius]|uniref:NUMOD4 domain-containing protein n=1 Tax=Hymenobacter lapidarius TaxID=1908237 RepID=UPI00130145C2|nr:NUMOD4 domain-containing protein [Hymenobacter lapidarius]
MEINEIWRAVVGFAGRYEVSNVGRVRSLPKGPLGKIRYIGGPAQTGYTKVLLSRDGKHHHFNIHTLVASAFIEKPASESPLCVNHKDGNKANNSVSNLEWVTYQENSIHAAKNRLSKIGSEHYAARFTDEEVLLIREAFRTTSSVELATRHGITTGAMSALIQGRTWKHLPVLNYNGRVGKLYNPRPDFEEAARKVHGATYDYSQVVYFRTNVHVTIICPTHGAFSQTPNTHMQGSGCQKCWAARRASLRSKN